MKPLSFSKESGIGTAWMVCSAVLYGGMNIWIKLGAPHLTVWQTAIGRFALGSFLIAALARPFHIDLRGRSRLLLAARAVSGTLAFLLMVQALQWIPLSVALILFYLWPVFTCLLSPWIAGEPTGKKEWLFVISALLGAALILWPDRVGAGLGLGHFLALTSSFFAGLAIILIRRLRRENNPLTIYFYFSSIGGILCLGPLLTQSGPLLPTSDQGWLCLVAVACFAMGAQVSMNQGMKYLKASKAGALMMIEVLTATTFGTLYLGESLTLRLAAGGMLILGSGAALIALPSESPERAS
jgi:drug/metabolite transporter (DMT)-like permease